MITEAFNDKNARDERIIERRLQSSSAMLAWPQDTWASWWKDGLAAYEEEPDASYRHFSPISLPAGGWSFDPRDADQNLGLELSKLFERSKSGGARDEFANAVIESCRDAKIIDNEAKANFVLRVIDRAAPARMAEILTTLLQSARKGHFEIENEFTSNAVYKFLDHVSDENAAKVLPLLDPVVKERGTYHSSKAYYASQKVKVYLQACGESAAKPENPAP